MRATELGQPLCCFRAAEELMAFVTVAANEVGHVANNGQSWNAQAFQHANALLCVHQTATTQQTGAACRTSWEHALQYALRSDAPATVILHFPSILEVHMVGVPSRSRVHTIPSR